MTENVRYYMWLAKALGIPSKSVSPLLERFKTAKAVYNASAEEIRACSFLSKAEKQKLADKSLEPIERDFVYCDAQNVGILTYEDEDYPDTLRKIETPPLLLYYRGQLPDWSKAPFFSIVGTRTMSRSCADLACEMAFDLAKMGAATVSGMALGIDGVCAAASLEAGGFHVAVLGSGIDYIYPPEHRLLYAEILRRGGLVMTEYAPYERPLGFHFPIRNRIISGLSEAVIVVEGDLRSGSLITAEHAKKQGKRVFAVPGSVKDKGSEGPLLLLKNGASPITCSDDIYDAYKDKYLPYLNGFRLTDGRRTNLSVLTAKYGIRSRNPSSTYRPSKEEEESLSLSSLAEGAASLVRRAVRSVKDSVATRKRAASLRNENGGKEKDTPSEEKKPSFWEDMSEVERKIFLAIDEKDGSYPDNIKVEGLSAAELISALINMEICGYVFANSGGIYRRSE
ncbi:MAG: DNA-processing protein DprA [Clostridia bacterium]|nr:DNA-processing protein DprA [Clostridia bacterium]